MPVVSGMMTLTLSMTSNLTLNDFGLSNYLTLILPLKTDYMMRKNLHQKKSLSEDRTFYMILTYFVFLIKQETFSFCAKFTFCADFLIFNNCQMN